MPLCVVYFGRATVAQRSPLISVLASAFLTGFSKHLLSDGHFVKAVKFSLALLDESTRVGSVVCDAAVLVNIQNTASYRPALNKHTFRTKAVDSENSSVKPLPTLHQNLATNVCSVCIILANVLVLEKLPKVDEPPKAPQSPTAVPQRDAQPAYLQGTTVYGESHLIRCTSQKVKRTKPTPVISTLSYPSDLSSLCHHDVTDDNFFFSDAMPGGGKDESDNSLIVAYFERPHFYDIHPPETHRQAYAAAGAAFESRWDPVERTWTSWSTPDGYGYDSGGRGTPTYAGIGT